MYLLLPITHICHQLKAIRNTTKYTTYLSLGKGKRGAHGKKILVARVFSLQKQVIYQIKAKRSNYLIKI